MAFKIVGTASALPERSVTNDELSTFLDTSDEWIFPRTGIKSRRVVTTESLDELASRAAHEALETAGITAADLSLIICTTTTGDHLVPAEACAIAAALGATCPAYDISAACAGFVFALDIADGWFARGRGKHVLIVSAEEMTRLVDWTDRATCVLFGDGAAAAVLEAGGESPLYLNLNCDPQVDVLEVPGVAGSSPFKQRDGEARANVLTMQGRRVFKFGVSTICDSVHAMCDACNIAPTDIDHFVFHQANERILAAATTRLGVENDRVVRLIEHTGNISSACIPLALDELVRSGKLTSGQLVALVGFGAGLDTGACLLRWA